MKKVDIHSRYRHTARLAGMTPPVVFNISYQGVLLNQEYIKKEHFPWRRWDYLFGRGIVGDRGADSKVWKASKLEDEHSVEISNDQVGLPVKHPALSQWHGQKLFFIEPVGPNGLSFAGVEQTFAHRKKKRAQKSIIVSNSCYFFVTTPPVHSIFFLPTRS